MLTGRVLLILTDADELLDGDPKDDETLIDVVADVGKEWAAVQRGESARRPVPFHACVVVPRERVDARADWRAPRLALRPA
jgi:hypothetical protein